MNTDSVMALWLYSTICSNDHIKMKMMKLTHSVLWTYAGLQVQYTVDLRNIEIIFLFGSSVNFGTKYQLVFATFCSFLSWITHNTFIDNQFSYLDLVITKVIYSIDSQCIVYGANVLFKFQLMLENFVVSLFGTLNLCVYVMDNPHICI